MTPNDPSQRAPHWRPSLSCGWCPELIDPEAVHHVCNDCGRRYHVRCRIEIDGTCVACKKKALAVVEPEATRATAVAAEPDDEASTESPSWLAAAAVVAVLGAGIFVATQMLPRSEAQAGDDNVEAKKDGPKLQGGDDVRGLPAGPLPAPNPGPTRVIPDENTPVELDLVPVDDGQRTVDPEPREDPPPPVEPQTDVDPALRVSRAELENLTEKLGQAVEVAEDAAARAKAAQTQAEDARAQAEEAKDDAAAKDAEAEAKLELARASQALAAWASTAQALGRADARLRQHEANAERTRHVDTEAMRAAHEQTIGTARANREVADERYDLARSRLLAFGEPVLLDALAELGKPDSTGPDVPAFLREHLRDALAASGAALVRRLRPQAICDAYNQALE